MTAAYTPKKNKTAERHVRTGTLIEAHVGGAEVGLEFDLFLEPRVAALIDSRPGQKSEIISDYRFQIRMNASDDAIALLDAIADFIPTWMTWHRRRHYVKGGRRKTDAAPRATEGTGAPELARPAPRSEQALPSAGEQALPSVSVDDSPEF